ncbi:MAG: hypothetical protein CSA81_05340 [Acidobacteria bacterium]|nr:MAG: hypothetical protein CSA81_05340 [Acidobacteriota bacterium]PIE90988.1 MAG: hypothetical protein CR997_03770 [Acidobacteriota bacterium]
MKYKLLPFLLLGGLMAMALETKGTEKESAEKTVEEKMTVTATRTEKAYEEVPNTISLIPVEELEMRTGYGSVADLLTDIPGIELRDSSLAGGKRLIIRGEGGNRVLVLIDGQRVSEQKSMDGVPLLVDTTNIEQIEIVKGPSSVLYGSDALGGVVNIITRKKGKKDGLSGSLTGSYNTGSDGYVGGLSLSQSSDRFSFHFAASKTDQSDRETPEGTIENTGYLYDSISANFGYNIGNSARLSAVYEKFDGSMESAFTEVQYPMTYFFLDLPEWNREKFGLSLDSLTSYGNMAKYSFSIYSQNTFKDFHNDMAFQFAPAGPPSTMSIRTENDLDSMAAFFQADFTLGSNHYLIAGIDYQVDDLNADEFQESIGFGPYPIVHNYFYDAEMKTLALFAQDEWTLSDSLTAYLGARATSLDFALNETNNANLETGSSDDSKVVGSLGLLFAPSDHYNLRFNLGQGFRYGTLQQLFIGTSHGSRTPTFPNPNLKPESSVNMELGVRLMKSQLGFDIAFFNNDAEDYITTRSIDGIRRYDNIDEAKTFGGEFNLDYDFENGYIPYVQATVLRRKFTSRSISTYNTGHPDLSGRLGLKYAINRSKSLSYSADLYVRYNSETDESYFSGEELQNIKTDSWTTLNLMSSLYFGSRGQYRAGLNVFNMTDKLYTVASETLIAPGRHFVLHFGANF